MWGWTQEQVGQTDRNTVILGRSPSGVAIQLDIGLASIAALTYRFARTSREVIAGAIGLVITAIAFLPGLFG